MLKLLDIPQYSFAFFFDEEIGCRGSEVAGKSDIFSQFNCYIGLDRLGREEIAIYGYDNPDLIKVFTNQGFYPVVGSVTDVAVLSAYHGIACVNLSVGFYHEHTVREQIVFSDLLRTLDILKDPEVISQLSSSVFTAEEFWGGEELCQFCWSAPGKEIFGFTICEDCMCYAAYLLEQFFSFKEKMQ